MSVFCKLIFLSQMQRLQQPKTEISDSLYEQNNNFNHFFHCLNNSIVGIKNTAHSKANKIIVMLHNTELRRSTLK